MATLLAISQFLSVAFMQLLQTLRHCLRFPSDWAIAHDFLFFI